MQLGINAAPDTRAAGVHASLVRKCFSSALGQFAILVSTFALLFEHIGDFSLLPTNIGVAANIGRINLSRGCSRVRVIVSARRVSPRRSDPGTARHGPADDNPDHQAYARDDGDSERTKRSHRISLSPSAASARNSLRPVFRERGGPEPQTRRPTLYILACAGIRKTPHPDPSRYPPERGGPEPQTRRPPFWIPTCAGIQEYAAPRLLHQTAAPPLTDQCDGSRNG